MNLAERIVHAFRRTPMVVVSPAYVSRRHVNATPVSATRSDTGAVKAGLVFLPLAGLAPSFGAVAASGGPLTARERAMAIIRAKGWDEQDKVLRSAICYRLIQALNMQAKRGNVARLGKQRGVIVWTLSAALPQAR